MAAVWSAWPWVRMSATGFRLFWVRWSMRLSVERPVSIMMQSVAFSDARRM